jgi:hypothetical protein
VTPAGWLFLIGSLSLVTGLWLFCVLRVLRGKPRGE